LKDIFVLWPHSLIANIDVHKQPGSHWIAFYFDENGCGEFFDSYGINPCDYPEEIENFLFDNTRNTFCWSTKKIQDNGSLSCGQFCVYFLYNRINKGIPMKKIVEFFDEKNRQENSCFVVEWFNKHFNMDTLCHSSFSQSCQAYDETKIYK
jgi:hypothetical protein